MNLIGIADYIESKRLGKKGTSLFIGEMPLEAKRGLLLIDTYSGSKIDHELPGWRDTGFRLVARSASYDDGYALAEQVLLALTIQRDTPMTKMLVKQCLPVNDPLPYRRSKGAGVWEFEVDFECVYIAR